MSYQSPIDVIMGQINIAYENEICKAVQNVGVNVDKNELLKALQYDRGQYQKGYADRDSEIVRCNECKYMERLPWLDEENFTAMVCRKHTFTGMRTADWYCADGERRDDDA